MASESPPIAYLTDVEGRWDKLETFTAHNPHVTLVGKRIVVSPGSLFVFGGDAVDRGPAGRQLMASLLDAKKRQPTQVILLAGNRDTNKLRLRRELGGFPPARTPTEIANGRKSTLLRWIFAHTMGAALAFEMRRRELATLDEDVVVESFLEDLAPGGLTWEYLKQCQLSFRSHETLFVHGSITEEGLGYVPGLKDRIQDLDAWLARLQAWYTTQLEAFGAGAPDYDALVAYQAPDPATRRNQASVVYGRMSDPCGNLLPASESVCRKLHDACIHRLVVGHSPSGDSPSILRSGGLEIISADNSYGRVEAGSKVYLTRETAELESRTRLDDGLECTVVCRTVLGENPSPLATRTMTGGHLVIGRALSHDGPYVLYKGLPNFGVEQKLAREP